MTLLADVVADPLTTLYTQWPWMVIVVTVAKWLATIGDKMANRHLSFLDAVDRREEERIGTDKQLAVALASISDELKDHSGKLSAIEKLKPAIECPVKDSWLNGFPPGIKSKMSHGIDGA